MSKSGTVKLFIASKGYGFIEPDGGGPEVFVHRDAVDGGGLLELSESEASSMLCELARDGDIERVRLLLEGGAEVNAADYDRRTCLHLAASEGNLSVVQLLCAHAAIEVNCADRKSVV